MYKSLNTSIFELQIIANQEFNSNILESGYPLEKLQKELNRNMTINYAQTKIQTIQKDYLKIEMDFLKPDDISVGGLKYYDTLNVLLIDPSSILFQH